MITGKNSQLPISFLKSSQIYSFANANVLLVLGELMGGDNGEDGAPTRAAIPLIAGAIVLAQVTMVRLSKV
jgi:hypothetical protein